MGSPLGFYAGVWKGEIKCSAFAGFRLEPNLSIVNFDDAFYKGQPDACAFGIGIEFIE
jgi:hypothetical protein